MEAIVRTKEKLSVVDKVVVFLIFMMINSTFFNNAPSLRIDNAVLFPFAIILLFFLTCNNLYSYKRLKPFLWMLSFMWLSVMWSDHLNFTYIFRLTILVFIAIFLSNNLKWSKYFIQILLLYSLSFAAITYVQALLPSIYNSYFFPLLQEHKQEFADNAENRFAFTGLTGQTALNATFITFGIAIIYSRITTLAKSKLMAILYYVILLFLLGAIMLCQKRSFIITNIFAAFIVFYAINGKRNLRFIWIALIVIVGMYFLSEYLPSLFSVIDKFLVLEDNIDNGRFNLWGIAWEGFLNSPFYGNGINTFGRFVFEQYGLGSGALGVHNGILQLLYEVGVIGTIIALWAIVSFWRFTYKTLKISLCIEGNYKYFIAISLYYQTFFLAYSMTGNVLQDTTSLTIYFILLSLVVVQDNTFNTLTARYL